MTDLELVEVALKALIKESRANSKAWIKAESKFTKKNKVLLRQIEELSEKQEAFNSEGTVTER